jgi:hypothetical protein
MKPQDCILSCLSFVTLKKSGRVHEGLLLPGGLDPASKAGILGVRWRSLVGLVGDDFPQEEACRASMWEWTPCLHKPL